MVIKFERKCLDIFLRSPVIDLNADGATGARLEFAQYRDADGFADSGEIRILRSSDFVQLGGTIDPDLTALDVDWTSFSASLPPEALGEMIVIEFRFLSDASADTFSGWSLDNVAVKLE